MFRNAFLCFQYPIFVSNIQCMFPIYNFCFQMQMMFPNDNVSNVCFQYTWSHFSLTSPFPWDSRFLIHFIGIWFISSLKWYVLKVFCYKSIYIQYTVRVSDRHCQFKPHCSIAVTAFQCSEFYVALELSYFISRRFLFNFIKIQIPILITLARKIKIPTL